MNNRPIIIVSPIEHFENITDLDSETLKQLIESIRVFCGFWNIKDYSVSYNVGHFKTSEHLYLKIKIPNDVIKKIRDDNIMFH
jgi:diadenosine tetraphosphate (Ap4A) HIT family hydrolase